MTCNSSQCNQDSQQNKLFFPIREQLGMQHHTVSHNVISLTQASLRIQLKQLVTYVVPHVR